MRRTTVKAHTPAHNRSCVAAALALLAACLAVALSTAPAQALSFAIGSSSLDRIASGNSKARILEGFATGSNNAYAAKVNNGDEDKGSEAYSTKAILYKTPLSGDSASIRLTNPKSNKDYYRDLGHANDMTITAYDGHTDLLVVTMNETKFAVVRFRVTGDVAYKTGNYKLQHNGKTVYASGIAKVSRTGNTTTYLFKAGRNLYTGDIDLDQNTGTISLSKVCSLKGKPSDWRWQGIEYANGTLYVCITHKGSAKVLAYNNILGRSGKVSPSKTVYKGKGAELEGIGYSIGTNSFYLAFNGSGSKDTVRTL